MMKLKEATCALFIFSVILMFVSSAQSIRDTSIAADYVIVCSSAQRTQADRLAQFRKLYSGLQTRIVPVESVYVSFPFPNAPDSSLRAFIMCATRSWRSPSPRYFVLAGNVNTIPSHKEPGLQIAPTIKEDSIFVDGWFVESDSQSPNRCLASIGRLPAWTTAQLDTLISKTIAYEEAPTDSWMSRSLALADFDTIDGTIFESCAADLQSWLSTIWFDTTMIHIRKTSARYQDLAGFLTDWRQGTAFVSLVGHGSPWKFSQSVYLTSSDLQALGNGTKLPICLFEACAQAFYRTDSASIVERLLFQHGGGAVATIASTGEVFLGDVTSFFEAFTGFVTTNSHMSLGEAFRLSQNSASAHRSSSTSRRLTLLGDPAIVPKHFASVTQAIAPLIIPNRIALAQNYPNPFNPSTAISYDLPRAAHVSLRIYNSLGQLVASLVDEQKAAGSYLVQWNASKVPSGIYFYRLQAGTFLETKKMILLR